MKFKEFLSRITGLGGFIPTPIFRWVIRTTPRDTARDEAIVAKVLQDANPRQNITGSYGLGPEQQMILQQQWIQSDPASRAVAWRAVPVKGAEKLCTTQDGIPVPNSIAEPGVEKMDLGQKVREMVDVPICPICQISADLCDCQEREPE